MSAVHEHRLRVRYAETDQMGRVHHANYLLYVEEARTRMMDGRGCSYAELERQGFGLVVRRVDLRYRAPAGYDDELVVRTRVESLRQASLVFAFEIARTADGTTLVTGSTELCCVQMGSAGGRPIPLPAQVRTALG